MMNSILISYTKIIALLTLFIFTLSVNTLWAQQPEDTTITETFRLGEVTITGTSAGNRMQQVDQKTMNEHDVQTAAQALELVPGVAVSLSGGRNEAVVYVRGFDLRRVPVFVDGVPVSVPYDGYIDLSRMLVGDVAKITVDKSFASLLYGANTMGGAINIVSMQPQRKFELNAGVGSQFSQRGIGAYSTFVEGGTKQKKWYAKAMFAREQNFFQNLPEGFDTTALEQNYKRDNSAFENIRYSLKTGYTPNATDEYVVSVSGIRSNKGVPVYLGDDPNVRTRFWQYPRWDKNGLYLHSRTALSANTKLKTRWFYDTYYNVLKSYDNDEYNSQTFRYTFTSIYDDAAAGGSVELMLSQIANHTINLGWQGKFEQHREYNKDETPRNITDFTSTVAVEDAWKLNRHLTVMGGAGLFFRSGIEADHYFAQNDSMASYPLKDDAALNFQLKTRWQVAPKQIVTAGIAKRSRFATMKDRYSYRIGRALPNPDLQSEQALNTEIAYCYASKHFSAEASAFYHFIDNTIQQVTNVQDDLWQLQNTGRAHFRGFEALLGWQPLEKWSVGTTYAYIEQQNKTNPDLHFIDVPEHRATTFLKYELPRQFFAMANATYRSKSYSTTDGDFSAPEFVTFDVNLAWHILESLKLNVSAKNIADRLYYLNEGYPESGRHYRVQLQFTLP
ncbi:MAG: TonB-dependent receptor [Salinivirgaceae bacterium]